MVIHMGCKEREDGRCQNCARDGRNSARGEKGREMQKRQKSQLTSVARGCFFFISLLRCLSPP